MPEFVQAVDVLAEKMYTFFLDLAFRAMQNEVERRTGLQLVPNANVTANATSSANNTTTADSLSRSSPILTTRLPVSVRSAPFPQ